MDTVHITGKNCNLLRLVSGAGCPKPGVFEEQRPKVTQCTCTKAQNITINNDV